MNSVLLDTSFLISLVDPNRAHHQVAMDYYRQCVQRRVPMMLSTVVISEFSVRQSINDLPNRNFLVLPFNADHAMACGLLVRGSERDSADDRVRVKDDFKLIAQCQCEGISHLLTEDGTTLTKYVTRQRQTGLLETRPVLLRDGLDVSWFENGQSHLIP